MVRATDKVVLNPAAADALRREFLAWQCRIRQMAARQAGGRPSSGMRPRVETYAGEVLSAGMVVLIVETEPENSTRQFQYRFQRTQDPNERYDNMLDILQGSYFQQPARFSDVMTALFGPVALAARLQNDGQCILDFEQFTQGYRIPCVVARLAKSHAFHQATLWHNRMFNEHLPTDFEILSLRPDWRHAAADRRDGK